jgi:hypothetical protein
MAGVSQTTQVPFALEELPTVAYTGHRSPPGLLSSHSSNSMAERLICGTVGVTTVITTSACFV